MLQGFLVIMSTIMIGEEVKAYFKFLIDMFRGISHYDVGQTVRIDVRYFAKRQENDGSSCLNAPRS